MKWKAHIKVDGKLVHLGYHATAEDAAVTRNRYIQENGLTDYVLNQVP